NDNDGLVDNVCFIIKGGTGAWADLLWPHMWVLYSLNVYIHGSQVWTYNFQLSQSLSSSGVGVLCHEMFHSLGAPDLYHYSQDNFNPVYVWGLMSYVSNPPRHMLAYMKYRYGLWIASIPEITSSGAYTLNSLVSSSNNCYKIASPNSATEYFVLEYRRDTGLFESSLIAGGLLIYRINTTQDGLGNSNGPPDEVYIYRPDGTTTADGSPALANFSLEAGRTSINDTTNPSCFLNDGTNGGISISDIGSTGDTISFKVNMEDTKIFPGIILLLLSE
ncbi:MAG: immune inhibitor A, partial [Desulfobacteraceae bacterium]|nr:immune inhibitor A [Desulfobacteraceae bacterium]